MGETISTLVFRPPPPTPIRANKFFYIRIPKSEPKEYRCSSASCGAMGPSEIGIFSDDYDDEMDVHSNGHSNSNSGNESPTESYFHHNQHSNNAANGYSCSNGDTNRNGDPYIRTNSSSNSNSNSNKNKTNEQNEYSIPAFFLRRKGAKVTILFSHGNAEDLGMMYRRMKEMAMQLCANVLAYDYTGYGLSTPASSQPSESMCYRNIEAAYNHLTKTMNIPPSEIILYGRSLGSGPSCYLAKKTADEGKSVAGLILHSPFLSIYRIVLDCRFNLMGDMFINRSRAKDIKCPVLIIHGTKDDVVPFWHGDELLRSFPSQYRAEPYWAEGLGHNQIETKRKAEYVQRVTSFIEKYVIPSTDKTLNQLTPLCIPQKEQYKPEKTLSECGKFVVNRTWMKHGFAIVNVARNTKKQDSRGLKKDTRILAKKEVNGGNYYVSSNLSPPKQKEMMESTSNNIDNNVGITISKAEADENYITDMKHFDTDELIQKAKEKNGMKLNNTASYELSRCQSTDSTGSTASRFIITKESWATTDDDAEVSFDNTKENIDYIGKGRGVSLQPFTNVCEMSTTTYQNEKESETQHIHFEEKCRFDCDSFDRYSVQDRTASPP